MPLRVVCLSPLSRQTLQDLIGNRPGVETVLVEEPPPAPAAVRAAVAGATVVISDKRHLHLIDRATLQAMAGCRLIQVPAVGFDAVDHRAAAELGIPVANAAGYNKEAVADWTLMAILTLLRRGAWGDRQIREGGWPKWEMGGRQLGSLTVGIIGLGNIGTAVATRLRPFGARLLFTDIVPRTFEGAEPVELEDLLQRSDVVCIHCVLDRDTRGLMDAR